MMPVTVILLLKLKTKGRQLQGEVPFWQQWGQTYLDRMTRNLLRYLPADTRIVCMTDTPRVVAPCVETFVLDGDQPGWWAKMNMFRAEVSRGRCLYLDLDNVIAGPIPELLALKPDPIIMLDDRWVPGMPNASMMLFEAERCRFLWDAFAADPQRAQRDFTEQHWPLASDQGFVTMQILRETGHYPTFFQDLLPDGYILNARVELEAGRAWQQARIVFGTYQAKPHESSHEFYRRHWAA